MGSEWPRDKTFRERWLDQVESDPDLKEGLRLTAYAIARRARWQDGTRALMSNRQLGQILRKGDATVRRRTDELQERGYLERVERGGRRGDGTITANVYDLTQPDSQPLTQMSGWDDPWDEPQPLTQVSDRDQSQPLKNASQPLKNDVSTAHPDERPLVVPSLYPLSIPSLAAGTDEQATSATPPAEDKSGDGNDHEKPKDEKPEEPEDPRCKKCGVAQPNHDRWMETLDNGDRHPFVMPPPQQPHDERKRARRNYAVKNRKGK
jgi:hypothetical protein